MERTDDFVKVWFWAVTDTTVPSDVSSGATSVDTDNWVSFSRHISTHPLCFMSLFHILILFRRDL